MYALSHKDLLTDPGMSAISLKGLLTVPGICLLSATRGSLMLRVYVSFWPQRPSYLSGHVCSHPQRPLNCSGHVCYWLQRSSYCSGHVCYWPQRPLYCSGCMSPLGLCGWEDTYDRNGKKAFVVERIHMLVTVRRPLWIRGDIGLCGRENPLNFFLCLAFFMNILMAL